MSSAEAIKGQLDQFRADFLRLRQEIGKVIVGQDDIVEGTLTALIAGGHVLLEGVPGLGKTLLVRTLADALHLKFQRIQFTPDLMPADLIGTNVVMETPQGGKKFEFQRGPVFANVLLADEINRATPKTQSALLESMQEHSVAVAGTTYKLPAILDQRYHVSREDLQAVAPMTLRHRLILNFEGQAEGVSTDQVVENVLETVAEPALV